MSNWLQSRQVRAGGYSGAYILVFVSILVAANYLASQYNKTFDATSDKLYSLSDQTHKILGDLENDVTIYYFDQARAFPGAKNSLVRYENSSSHVTVKYIDPESDVGTAQTMNVRNFGTVIVQMGANREEASTTGEEDVTNAIIKLLKGGDKKACIVTGHGEASVEDTERAGFSAAQTAIRNANYEIETISLAESGAVPPSCTVVVIAGPSQDFFAPEIDGIRSYVLGGGRVLLMLDGATEGEKTPQLVNLASEWGVQAPADIVIDFSLIGQMMGGGPLSPLVSEYDTTHKITQVMTRVRTLFPQSRTVESGDAAGWSATELFKTSTESFSTNNFDAADGELVRHPESESEGPINIAVASTFDVPQDASAAKAAPEGEETPDAEEDDEKQARVVVVGSSSFARNATLMHPSVANLDLFLNMLSWLSSDEDLISIRPKDPASTPMDVSQSQMRWLFFGLVLGLPLAIVIAGVRTWWVRR